MIYPTIYMKTGENSMPFQIQRRVLNVNCYDITRFYQSFDQSNLWKLISKSFTVMFSTFFSAFAESITYLPLGKSIPLSRLKKSASVVRY